MKYATHKGKEYVYNEFLMEIYRVEQKEKKEFPRFVKVRDFHKYENLLDWKDEQNSLINSILK